MPLPEDSQETIPETLAELFCYLATRRLRLELEQFRVQFEEQHGPTNFGHCYSSQLPTITQIWLLNHHPKRYFNGLPPFAQEFMRCKMQEAQRVGALDDMPSAYIGLFLRGEMPKGPNR